MATVMKAGVSNSNNGNGNGNKTGDSNSNRWRATKRVMARAARAIAMATRMEGAKDDAKGVKGNGNSNESVGKQRGRW